MTNLTRAETATWLRERDGFLILTHRRPDGDTIGSAALLCRALRSLGKCADILQNPELTPRYAGLHAGLTRPEAGEADTLVCVDVAAANMLPDCFGGLAGRIALRIDHHTTATPFTELALVDAGAGACGEIIADVLEELGVRLDVPMALALYTAVATDTGRFCYANTTAHSLRTAARCYDTGADLGAVNREIFETVSLPKLRIQGWIVEHTRFFADGRAAVCAISREVERSLGVTEDDMENISGFLRGVEGVQVAATLRETGGAAKVSIRALPGCDAAAICARFGGGGHRGAAGATLKMPLSDAAETVARAIAEVLA